MTKPVTEILSPPSEAEYVDYIRMLSNEHVGGLALRNLLTEVQLEQMIAVQGLGFSALEEWSVLYDTALTATGTSKYELQETGVFIHSHEWHRGTHQETPTLRLWLHLRGEVELWLAHSSPYSYPGYGFSDEQVIALSSASPTKFVPEPGDALLFVDRGCLEVTGRPAFHKSEVLGQSPAERLSIACDIDLF